MQGETGSAVLASALQPLPGRRLLLSGILSRPGERMYELDCATLIANLEDLADVERAFREVAPAFRRTVETLALQGIAIRIAKIQPERDSDFSRDEAREKRRAELARLPADYRARVEPFVATFYKTQPWLKRGRKGYRE